MQTEDIIYAPGSHPFPAAPLDAGDADFSDAGACTDWPPVPLHSLLTQQVLSDHRPHREASRRLPEAISAH